MIILLLIETWVGTLNIFCFCYFGILSSEYYELMSERLYESNWLDLPIGLKKYFIIMIKNAQSPVYYQGCKMITLNMKTFGKV